MIRVCRLRNPRVGTWSSSEPDSLAPLNFGLPARPTVVPTAAPLPATAPVIPPAPAAADPPSAVCCCCINLMAGSVKRGLVGNDSWPTFKPSPKINWSVFSQSQHCHLNRVDWCVLTWLLLGLVMGVLVDGEWWGIPASREGPGCWLGCCRWPLRVRPWWRRDSWRVPSATTAYSPTDWERSGDRSSRRTRSDNSPPRRVARMESIRNPATQSKIIIIYPTSNNKRKRKNEEFSTSAAAQRNKKDIPLS